MKWFVLYQIISGDFEGVGVGCKGEADRRGKEESVPLVSVELTCCRGPSTSRPTRQNTARKKKSATPVGMTELGKGAHYMIFREGRGWGPGLEESAAGSSGGEAAVS